MIDLENFILGTKNLCNNKKFINPDSFTENENWNDLILFCFKNWDEIDYNLTNYEYDISWKSHHLNVNIKFLNEIMNINHIPKRKENIEQNIFFKSQPWTTKLNSSRKHSLSNNKINSPQLVFGMKFHEKLGALSHTSLVDYEKINSIIAKKIINGITNCYTMKMISMSYFNKINIVNKPELNDNISKLLNNNLKETLYKIVLLSRDSEEITIAASNAITILNRNNFNFRNKNLEKIKIQGADLSFGLFENVKFESSDLREVNFANSSLLRVNFKNCNMENARFGQTIYANCNKSIKCLKISPSGRYLIALYNNSCIIDLWDILNFRLATRLEGNNEILKSFISSNEYLLISTDTEHNICIWNLLSKEIIEKINNGSFYDIALSPCGHYIAISKKLYEVELLNWNTKTKEIIRFKDSVRELVFSPKGTYFSAFIYHFNYNIDLCNLKDKSHKILKVNSLTKFLVFSPCEKFIIFESNRQLLVWKISENKYSLLYMCDQAIEGLWATNGKLIFMNNYCIGIIKGDTLSVKKYWFNDRETSSVAISPHSKSVYTSGKDGKIKVSCINECKFDHGEDYQYEISAVDFSPNSKFFASAGNDIILWDAKTFLPIKRSLKHHFFQIIGLKFTYCGDFIISVSGDKMIIWDIHNLDVFRELELDMECTGVTGFCLAPSQKFAVFQNGVTVYMIDFECVDYIQIFIVNTMFVQNMNMWVSEISEDVIKAFWINKNSILTINADHSYKVDNIGLEERANFGALSPCGNYIIFSYKSKLIRWDIKEMKILTEGNYFGKSSIMVYSHSGNLIALNNSLDHDNKIIIRNAKNLETIQECCTHQGSVTCISFSSNDDIFISGGDDGTIKIWRVNPSSNSKYFFVPRSKFWLQENPIVTC